MAPFFILILRRLKAATKPKVKKAPKKYFNMLIPL